MIDMQFTNQATRLRTGTLLSLLAAVLPALAQEPAPLNLKQCIAYSLEQHPSSTVFRNEARIAHQRNIQSLSAYLPQVAARATFDDNIKRQVTVIPAGAFGPEPTVLQFGNQYNTGASVQLDQKIYDQTAITALSAMKINRSISDINILKNNETLIYNTARAYYQALVQDEQHRLLEENERKYRELRIVMALQYEKGVIKQVDYNRVKVSLNNITAQKAALEASRELSLNRLKNAMGMPLEEALRISPTATDTANAMPADVSGFDYKNRFDYRLQEQSIRLQEIDVKSRRAAFLPTLGMYGRYGAQTFGNEFRTSFDKWFDYSSVGLTLNIPLFSGLQKNSLLQQSRLTLLNANENLKISAEGYKLDYENARVQLLSSYTNLLGNKENLDLAKEVFETTGLQLQQGAVPMSDLLNADYAYKEAQSNYINTLLTFLSSRLDFEKARGTLVQYISTLN